MSDEETLDRAAELMEWARGHDEVRLAIVGMVARHGYASLGELAEKDPGLFDLLYDAMKGMLEQLPWT